MTGAERHAWLDLCRALAILLVLLSHGRFFLNPVFPAADAFRFGGFLGVELFFVLSGFLIGGILIGKASDRAREDRPWLQAFYARRWFRTLPNYYLFLAINVLLVWIGLRPGPLAEAWRYAVFIQNLFWPSPAFFAEAWSLAVEEVFYLLFPLCLLALARVAGWSPRRAILPTALAVVVLSLLARLLVADSVASWDDGIRKVVFLRLDALMFGVLLAWWHGRPGEHTWAHGALVSGALVLFVASAAYFVRNPEAGLDHSYFAKTFYLSLTSIGCAGVVIAGLRWNPPPALTVPGGFVARVSYAAYLTNIPVAMAVLMLADRWGNDTPATALLMWSIFMGASIASAYLVHLWVERPCYRLRDRLVPA